MNCKNIGNIFCSGLTRNEQIAELIKLGFKSREIQQMMHCGPNIICDVRKSLKTFGSAPEQSKIGRPTKKTKTVSSFIVQQTHQNPYISGTDLHHQIIDSIGIDISPTVINEIRGEEGFKFLPPIKEPLLTEIQIEKRMNFCYSVLIHLDDLPNIGFSDESRFGLGSDKRWVWRKRKEHNQNAIIQQAKYSISVMAWGLIGPDYKPHIYIYDSTENAKNYQEMLIDNSFLEDAETFYNGDFAFQQDGARPHTAKTSIETITDVCDLVANWPPNSPDLNVIEMIWSIMDDIISFYHPNNKEELIDSIKCAWNSIKLETINNLCRSFARRCYLCLQNHGHCIQRQITRGLNNDITKEEIEVLFDESKKDGYILNEVDLFIKKKINE